MEKKKRTHKDSFIDAFRGLAWAIQTQPNLRIHIILSLAVILSGAYFQLTTVEMAIVLVMIVLGLSGEMINTALESMTDLITTEYRTEAKIAKDVAAAMMLTIASGAIIVAAWIFIPHIIQTFF